MKLGSELVQLAWSETVPASLVVKVKMAEAVPFEPERVCVAVAALVMPEGVTVTLADGVPTPDAEASVTVAEMVWPRLTLAGAVMVKIAASGWTVTLTVPFEEA